MTHEIWQAYDCPLSGIDFDLHGADLVHKGQSFHCPGCGQDHIAGVDVQVETCIETGGARRFCDLPGTAGDLARIMGL